MYSILTIIKFQPLGTSHKESVQNDLNIQTSRTITSTESVQELRELFLTDGAIIILVDGTENLERFRNCAKSPEHILSSNNLSHGTIQCFEQIQKVISNWICVEFCDALSFVRGACGADGRKKGPCHSWNNSTSSRHPISQPCDVS